MNRGRERLADLLSDAAGNLSPAAMELLAGAPRRPVRMRRRPQRHRRRNRTDLRPIKTVFILILGSVSAMALFSYFEERPHSETYQAAYSDHNMAAKEPIRITETQNTPVRTAAIDKYRQERQVQEKAYQPSNISLVMPETKEPVIQPEVIERPIAAESRLSVREISRTRENLGEGVVFGFGVNIRRAPGLLSPVIRKTNQGEIFSVESFSDGWYRIRLGGGQTAYIFGAYILPKDFNGPSYRVGKTRNGTKLLLRSRDTDGRIQVVLPDGKEKSISRTEVSFVN